MPWIFHRLSSADLELLLTWDSSLPLQSAIFGIWSPYPQFFPGLSQFLCLWWLWFWFVIYKYLNKYQFYLSLACVCGAHQWGSMSLWVYYVCAGRWECLDLLWRRNIRLWFHCWNIMKVDVSGRRWWRRRQLCSKIYYNAELWLLHLIWQTVSTP